MSRYKPYQSYKDSGVEWLGEVPEHWQSIKFKHILFEKKKETNIDLNCGSISFGEVVFKDDEKIPEETKASYQEVLAGEFLVNPLNLNYDLKSLRTALSKIDVVVSSGYIVLKSHDNSNKNYLRWLLYQFDVAHMKTLGSGVRQTINYADIGNSYFLEPTPDEQVAITNFLDIQTAKIDTLIAKQQRMIELLGEKRQALISHAVTKGLDLNVKMKDSGVAWLGEIPKNWGLKPLRHLGSLQNGISKGAEYFGSGYPFVNYGDVYKNMTLPTSVSGLASSSIEDRTLYSVQEGDTFFTRTSETVEEIGFAATCLQTIDDAIFSGFVIRFRASNQSLYNGFSKFYFRSLFPRLFFVKEMNLVTRASLGQELLKKLPVLLPPIQEQKEIAKYLDDKTAKIDTLIAKARQAIELMKERRTALISAAVTGKIDVRVIR